MDDLRTLSLAEADELPLRDEVVDVAELLTDVRSSFSGQVAATGLDLRVKVGKDLPTITGDVRCLEQVFSNLMANALRHAFRGERITLKARRADQGVHIVVGDNGEGIPAEDLPYIFDRFWRGDRSRSRAEGGE